jgi:hypothetical protein
MSTRACAEPVHVLFVLPGRICLQGPVLHLCGSVYKAILLHLDVSARLNEQGSVLHLYGSVRVLFCAAPGHVCLQVPVLYLSCTACLQGLCAAPGRFCLAHGTPGFARSTHKLFGLVRKNSRLSCIKGDDSGVGNQ